MRRKPESEFTELENFLNEENTKSGFTELENFLNEENARIESVLENVLNEENICELV